MNEFDISDLIYDPIPLFPEPLSLSNEDLVKISQSLEQLTIDVNTNSIKLELETLKRQRLCRSLKQAKAEILVLNQALTQQNYEYATLKEQVATLSNTLFSELAALRKALIVAWDESITY